MKKKALSLILAAAMVGTLMVGCGKKEEAAPAETPAATEEATDEAAPADDAEEAEDTEEAAAPAGNFATVPATPDTEGMTSNEWLLAQTDKIPLSGVVSNHFESRADVEKGIEGLKAKKGKDIKIACLMASQGTQFFTTLSAAVQERCDEYGYDVTFFDSNFDLGTQQDQYEQVLAADYDYIICNACDIDATAEMYRQTVEKGIPVVVTGPTAGKDEYNNLTTILSGSWAAGYATGEYTAEYCYRNNVGYDGTALKWGAVVDKMGDADSESRPNGFIAGYLYKYAELTGQDAYESKWDAAVAAYQIWTELRDKGSYMIDGILDLTQVVCTNEIATSAAQPKCAELLAAHPDLDIAFVETDSFGLAMVTELYQTGMKPGEDIMVVYAADGTGDLCNAIKKGEVLCIGVNVPTYNGYGAVDLCYYILNDVKDCQDLPENSFTPTYCVTPDNVDEVYTEGNLYADPMDWNIQTTDEYNEANA